MVSQLNEELSAFSPGGKNTLDLKINKMKDYIDGLSKQYAQLLERLTTITSPDAPKSLTGIVTVTLGHEGHPLPVKIHQLEPGVEDPNYYTKTATRLKQMDPESVHIVVRGDRIIMSLDRGKFPNVHAGKLLNTMLKHTGGGKAGGKHNQGQGRMKGDEPFAKLVELTAAKSDQ